MKPELLRHLQSTFGQEVPRPLTVSALLEELETYESGADPQDLAGRLEALGLQVEEAAAQTMRELEAQEWSLELGLLLQEQLDGYRGLEVGLRRGRRRVEHGASVDDVIAQLVSMQGQIRRATDQLGRLFATPSWRCPACGGQGCHELCPDCGVQPLLWDESPDQDDDGETLQAGPRAESLYCLISRILEGRASLWELATPVDQLACELESLRGADRQGDLESALRELEEGLEWLSHALESRRISHLLQGWNSFYRGVLALRQMERFAPLAVAS